MKQEIGKIRLYWTSISVFLLIGLFYSSIYFMNNGIMLKNTILMEFNYLRYKTEFSMDSKSGITGFFALGENKPTSDSTAKGIPVLLYHGIKESPSDYTVSLETFKEQMFTLKKEGYQTVTLEEFNDFIKGEKELPEKSFLLTFDDGRKDSYYPTDPILRSLDYNAVMFVITEHLNEDYFYLSKSELKNMISTGRWEIQPHGKESHSSITIKSEGDIGHYLSNKMWVIEENRLESDWEFKTRIKNELIESKNDLESYFDIEVISFAFPYGDFGQINTNYKESKGIIINLAQDIYQTVFYQYHGTTDNILNLPGESFMIKRIEVDPNWDANELLDILERSNQRYT